MVIDRTEFFLEKMATNIAVAQWAYPGNQFAARTQHMSKQQRARIMQIIHDQDNEEPQQQ